MQHYTTQKRVGIVALCFLLSACPKTSTEVSHVSKENAVVLSLSRAQDPRSLDPQAQLDSTSRLFISALYDTLLTYNSFKRPLELRPHLLEKMPDISTDQKTYQFTLRKGIYFQNDPAFIDGKGRELVADDVVYTLKRFADAHVNQASWYILDGLVTGMNEFRSYSRTVKKRADVDYSGKLKGVEVIGPYAFKIELNHPDSSFMHHLAINAFSIVPREAVEKYGDLFSKHPVGSGPFSLFAYKKSQRMIFIKNENYFLRYPVDGPQANILAGKKLPLVDEMHIYYVEDSKSRFKKFLRGELDVMPYDQYTLEKFAGMDPKTKSSFQFTSSDDLTSYYYVFNMKNPLFKSNVFLRKAIAAAFSQDRKIELVIKDQGRKLRTMAPPSLWGGEHEIGDFSFETNLEKARQYLEKAGYRDPKDLPVISVLFQGSSGAYEKRFDFLEKSLGEIGIRIKPEYKTWTSYLQTVQLGKFEIAASGWEADYPDVENFYQLLYGKSAAPGPNRGSYQNAAYDRLFEQLKELPNNDKKLEVLKKMAEIIREEAPLFFDYTAIETDISHPWVENILKTPLLDSAFIYYFVHPEKRNAYRSSFVGGE